MVKRAIPPTHSDPPPKRQLVSGFTVTDADVNALLVDNKNKLTSFESSLAFLAREKKLWGDERHKQPDDVRRAAAVFYGVRFLILQLVWFDYNTAFKVEGEDDSTSSADDEGDRMSLCDDTAEDDEVTIATLERLKNFVQDPQIGLSKEDAGKFMLALEDHADGKPLLEHRTAVSQEWSNLVDEYDVEDAMTLLRKLKSAIEQRKGNAEEMSASQLSALKKSLVMVHIFNLIQAQLEDTRNIAYCEERG